MMAVTPVSAVMTTDTAAVTPGSAAPTTVTAVLTEVAFNFTASPLS